jgi:hypothetical protein
MDTTQTFDALIMFKDGKTFGSIRGEDVQYNFYTLDNGDQILLEVDSEGLKKSSCKILNPSEQTKKLSQPGNSARQAACAEPLRILFTYNSAAVSTGLPLTQVAQMGLQRYNEAIYNSGIGDKITNIAEYVGIASLNFDETYPTANTGLGDFDQLRSKGILSLRNTYNADICVQLVAGGNNSAYFSQYSNVAGLANTLAVNNQDYSLCIVVAAYANSNVVAHEIGHLLAAGHEVQDHPNQVSYARAASIQRYPGVFYNTIMWSSTGSSFPYFSTPSNVNGQPVGDATRNNARRINEWSPTVGAFQSSPAPNVGIDGPAVVFTAGTYTYEAVYQCRTMQSVSWQTSYDGYNYTNAGTGESIGIYIGQRTYVRVTVVYVGGGTATYSRIINAFCPGCRTGTEVVDTDPESLIYPNPADKEITVKFTLTEKAEVSRMIVDMAGKSVERLNFGTMKAGTHEQKINVSSLPPDAYMINLRLGNKTVRQKLLIVR